MTAAARAQEFGDGALSRVTRVVYRWLAVGLLVSAGSVPTLLLTASLDRSSGNALLAPLCLLPAVPCWSAALFTLERPREADDDGPVRTFGRGLRLNTLDVLKLWLPTLAVLGVVATSVVHRDAAGISTGYAVVLVAVGVLLLLWALGALLVASVFAFRTRDVARLATYYLGRRPAATAGFLALLVVAAAVVTLAGEVPMALLAVVWLWFLLRAGQPVLDDVRRRFVAGPGPHDPEEGSRR